MELTSSDIVATDTRAGKEVVIGLHRHKECLKYELKEVDDMDERSVPSFDDGPAVTVTDVPGIQTGL